MEKIDYIDRKTGRVAIEKVYGGKALKFIYGDDWVSKFLGTPLLHLLVKSSWFSSLYGYWQKHPISKKKIQPFIDNFQVDSQEFQENVQDFNSFNDFFIRKLKPAARPIAPGANTAVIPADGRYRFIADISLSEGFIVKGRKFDLATLLQNAELAKRYAHGSMVMARLCPSDYHRYHFPCDCLAGKSTLINGWLQSVNPIATKKRIQIFTENKRTLCELKTDHFANVLYLEIGATNVGSINQTYLAGQRQQKGAEKGFFAFGGSALILLFEPNQIIFDQDLLDACQNGQEVRCLMGQSMGSSPIKNS